MQQWGKPSEEYNFYNKLIKYSQHINLLSQHFGERPKEYRQKKRLCNYSKV